MYSTHFKSFLDPPTPSGPKHDAAVEQQEPLVEEQQEPLVEEPKRDYEPATEPPIAGDKLSKPIETYTPTEDGKSNYETKLPYQHTMLITTPPFLFFANMHVSKSLKQ